MSAYIVDDNTIHAIVKGFIDFHVDFASEDYTPETICGIMIDLDKTRNRIGQSLLNQNYKSVNYRYDENTKAPEYKYKDVDISLAIVYGCIGCYEYQACETPDYSNSKLHASLDLLKDEIAERAIRRNGEKIPYGYNNYLD